MTLNGSGGVPFDFGPTSGDTSMEFILEGDPTAGADAYLAVGQNTTSNLRYAQWSNTRQMGFTQLAVADYLFTPAVASPTAPTHVAYVWNSTTFSMNLYTNGVLAGTKPGVSDRFALPTGPGFLGGNSGGGEAMVGRIFRIVVYAGMVPEATIQKHGQRFCATPHRSGPSLSIAVTGSQAAITLQGVSGTHYQVQYRNSLSAADTWQLLQDIPSLSGTSIKVVDPTATTGRSQRFYRAPLSNRARRIALARFWPLAIPRTAGSRDLLLKRFNGALCASAVAALPHALGKPTFNVGFPRTGTQFADGRNPTFLNVERRE